MADDYSPVYTGDTAASLSVQFQHKDGTYFNLAGATISMKMQLSGTTTSKTGAGTWTIDDQANGQAHYAYAAADVDTAGAWLLYIKIVNSSGTIHADPKTLVILPVP